MDEQEKQTALRVSAPGAVLHEITRRMEAELKDFKLPPDEYPEYVDVFVRYPEVLAKIRITVKRRDDV